MSYLARYYVMLGASGSHVGTVAPGNGWYDSNASFTLMASAPSGGRFLEWKGSGTGSYSGSANPVTFLLAGPVNETAIFGPALPPTVLGLPSLIAYGLLGGIGLATMGAAVAGLWYRQRRRSRASSVPDPAST